MKITGLTAQQKFANRVNVMVDGAYRFSLDVVQVADLGIRVGKEYSDTELLALEEESQFGKLYARALEYCMVRPRSKKEMRDYLWRKTRATKYKSRSGEIREREGVSEGTADRVLKRLEAKGYIDDAHFARYWVENRHQRKGISSKKLQVELRTKGVEPAIIDGALKNTERDDSDELAKIIIKKARRYPEREKFIAYLMRQGFRYDDIVAALTEEY
ncbi:hypothetical protein FJZ39_03435 [Candidatus Saccharibacteria bacterium]|nr:hypothetical protein [Candidatus Saccharibacteria bacterium]